MYTHCILHLTWQFVKGEHFSISGMEPGIFCPLYFVVHYSTGLHGSYMHFMLYIYICAYGPSNMVI